jgi:L-ascorbate metabolism protein UlaG (beta-lactamase superfamily)
MRRILWGVLAVAALLTWIGVGPARAADGKVHMLWLGQAAWRITTPNGKIIVIDPWLTGNPKCPPEYKNLDKIGKMDIILVTHGHGDHLGDSVALAKKYDAPVWGPAGLDQQLVTLGYLPANLAPRMGKGGTITPFGPDIKIMAVHAEHSSEMLLKDPVTGKDTTYAAGEPVGYIITLENGLKIYHMGDTALFGDMKLIGDLYHPDVVLIPIGGHFVMDPVAAAYAINVFLKPAHAIPMHYGTIPQLKGTPEEFIKALGNTSTKVHVMTPGEEIDF